jgi:hypothetical protein
LDWFEFLSTNDSALVTLDTVETFADRLVESCRVLKILQKCSRRKFRIPMFLYRLLRAFASIGVTEETTLQHFRLIASGKQLRKAVAESVRAVVIGLRSVAESP